MRSGMIGGYVQMDDQHRPLYRLCYLQPDDGRLIGCDRQLGHMGAHSWARSEVWAVAVGNYEPTEVVGIYASEELARQQISQYEDGGLDYRVVCFHVQVSITERVDSV